MGTTGAVTAVAAVLSLTPPGWVVVGAGVLAATAAGIYFDEKVADKVKSRAIEMLPALPGVP
jgi:hypothetical protein